MELLVLLVGLSYLGYGLGFSIGYMESLYPHPAKKPSYAYYAVVAFAWPALKGLHDGAKS